MPKVIIVQGKSNTRKTTGIVAAMNALGVFDGSGARDVRIAARIHINGTGYQIGFASGGDDLKTMQHNISFFSKRHLDHMIFACRTKGKARAALDAFVQKLAAAPIRISAPHTQLAAEILKHIP